MRLSVRCVPLVAAVVLGLTACSSSTPAEVPSTTAAPASSGPIGGDVLTPLTRTAGELQGATVDLVVGQVLNINTGDLAVDSYSGTVADSAIAEFTPGRTGNATFNPGIKALKVGETDVTLTNADGGIEPLTFTVVVADR